VSASEKLQEARFFLELLDAMETRKLSLTMNATCEEEASYLLSAVLNALYSALEQAKPVLGVDSVKAYKEQHSAILRGKSGLRNITVHERHVGPECSGYIPPAGNAVKLDLRPTPKLIVEIDAKLLPANLNRALGANHYIAIDGELRDITELCFEQYYALRRYLQANGIVT